MESSRRRSLRKREEKSYVESPDLIFEEETSSSSSNKGKNVVSNGDVEMESDDDDEPLDPLPLPKVRNPSDYFSLLSYASINIETVTVKSKLTRLSKKNVNTNELAYQGPAPIVTASAVS